MKNTLRNILLIAGLSLFVLTSCKDDIDPIVEELQYDRAFTPLEVTARIRNMTTAELSWGSHGEPNAFVVEISESADFSSPVVTETVDPDDLPYQVALAGETIYYARVKAVKEGTADSNWATVSFQTDVENIFLPLAGENIDATTVVLNWTPGSTVSHLLISPGDIQREITAEEAAAGEAIVGELTGDTDYTVKLFNGNKQRGTVEFTTLIDIGDAVRVYPEDDLSAVIAAAADGDVLVLYPGDYLAFSGVIVINKNLSIRGLYPYDKPKVHVGFELTDGVQDVRIQDLEMNGDATLVNAFAFTTSGTAYGALTVENCVIHDYTRALFGGTGMASTLQTLAINNSLVYDIVSDGGDFIDFRVGYVANLNITNSTFSNCAPGRDFVRLDNSSANFPGLVSTVNIENCTLFGVSDATNRRILYVRFADNSLSVSNTLIAETDGVFTNQTSTSQPACSNNNYFNAPGFHTAGYVSNVKIDESGNFTTLDPGFADAANRDFTVSHQTIIDERIGDPRWLP